MELSYLAGKEQQELLETMQSEDCTAATAQVMGTTSDEGFFCILLLNGGERMLFMEGNLIEYERMRCSRAELVSRISTAGLI